MKIEEIKDKEELIKECKKIGAMSILSLSLTLNEIEKWKRNGFLGHLKRELADVDAAGVLKFACTSALLTYDSYRTVQRTYIPFFVPYGGICK